MLPAVFLPLWAGAAEPAPPSASDVAGVDRVEEVRISPDGRSLVYALTSRDRKEGEVGADGTSDPVWTVQTQLWGVRELGATPTPPRRLTTARADASAPEWAPDGSALAFLRDVEDAHTPAGEPVGRLHVLPMDGGEAATIDTGDLSPSVYAWAPDGRSFAFAAPVPETGDEEAARGATGGVVRFGREHRAHVLWTVLREGGEPVRLGTSDAHVVQLAWSPDGTRLAVTASDTGEAQDAMMGLRPFVVGTDGTWRALDEERGALDSLCWSPDGRRVAWLSAGDTLTLLDRLQVADADGGARTDLAKRLDATLTDVAWTTNDTLAALVTEHTRSVLYRVAADGSGAERLPGIPDRTALAGLDAGAGRLATIASSPSVPGEPAWIDLAAGTSGTVPTGADVAGWAMGPVEVVKWKGPGGAALEGVLTLPPGNPTGRIPLLVLPHGGPDSVSIESFFPWARFFAGQGYAVLQPNYRGGTGYGRAFYAANRGKLGDIEFGDIEAGVDALVRSGRVDPGRLLYGGWSWGGYLTAWTIGHTDRYRAAFAGAAVVDVVTQYALSDVNYGVAAEWEYLGTPWTAPKRFSHSNPANALGRAKTPTLIAHGEADQRVDLSSSILLWRALTDNGIDTELMVFPGEPHGFGDPVHQTHLLEQWAAWYARYLQTPVAAAP